MFCLHGQEWLLGWSYCFDWWLTLLFFVPMPLSQWWGVCVYVAMFTDLVGELIWHRCGAQNKSDVFDCGDGVLLFGSSLWSFGVVFWSLMLMRINGLLYPTLVSTFFFFFFTCLDFLCFAFSSLILFSLCPFCAKGLLWTISHTVSL